MYHWTTWQLRFLTHLDLVIEWFPTRTLITLTLSNCWRVPITINSVLSSFNIRLFCWVHSLMSAMHSQQHLNTKSYQGWMKGITENRLHRSELQVGEHQWFQLNSYSRGWITAAQDRTLAERHSQEEVSSIAYDQQLPAATDQRELNINSKWDLGSVYMMCFNLKRKLNDTFSPTVHTKAIEKVHLFHRKRVHSKTTELHRTKCWQGKCGKLFANTDVTSHAQMTVVLIAQSASAFVIAIARTGN